MSTSQSPTNGPSVAPSMGFFDRFADRVARRVAHAWFFAACVLLVVLWVPTLALLDVNTSQLIINTLTTIVTFLLVALLQNSQQRFENAVHAKLDAQSRAVAALLRRGGLNPYEDRLHAGLVDSLGAEQQVGS